MTMAQILHASCPEQGNGYAGARLFGGSRVKALTKRPFARQATLVDARSPTDGGESQPAVRRGEPHETCFTFHRDGAGCCFESVGLCSCFFAKPPPCRNAAGGGRSGSCSRSS